MRPVDNCGNCVTVERAVTVQPRSVAPQSGGIRASYQCPGCGHQWQTCWHPGALTEQPERVLNGAKS